MIETSLQLSLFDHILVHRTFQKSFVLAMFGEVNVLHHHAVTTPNSREQNFILSV